MKNTAIAIRNELRRQGLYKRGVSVRCSKNYVIHVTITDDHSLNEDKIESIAISEFNKEPHSWLMLCVNGAFV